MASRNCILIPTRPQDYEWTYALLDTASDQERIALIFSSEDEAAAFNHHFPYIKLVATTPPDDCAAIITFKKFEGLKQLQNEYDYIAVIDTESQFMQATTPHLEEIWYSNCLVINPSDQGSDVLNICLNACGITDYPLPTNLYWWFNEIPVYPTAYLSEFFDWLSDKPLIFSDYYCFDYLLFGIFLIMQKDQQPRVLNIPAKYGAIESLPDIFQAGTEFDRSLLTTVRWSTWYNDVALLNNILMVFHLDRYPRT